jgi:hypothetical protein
MRRQQLTEAQIAALFDPLTDPRELVRHYTLSETDSRTTAQHVAGYERQRRHATLVAVTLDLIASLTDQAIDLFDRLVGTMFRKAEGRHARAFQADGRAINEKVRLYRGCRGFRRENGSAPASAIPAAARTEA